MNDIQERVTRCFANIFPGLPPSEIARASTVSLAAWDSVAHVTLLSSIAEEFDQQFELDDYEELISFQLIVDHLESKLNHG